MRMKPIGPPQQFFHQLNRRRSCWPDWSSGDGFHRRRKSGILFSVKANRSCAHFRESTRRVTSRSHRKTWSLELMQSTHVRAGKFALPN
ncbi:hypothetical protein KIN20_028270 [Parelaphostrongylus tenuis]|uniref:Uncharacterized protein n=1 Tax=Parelaphostrongylus tenuis TaxID=148309 RepID=A0AAD5WEI8_PARTN|nr:hypothetical protein KIN20_028270 [Parelaphostrongylus tenuis]